MKDLICKSVKRKHSKSLWLQGRDRFLKCDSKAENIQDKIDDLKTVNSNSSSRNHTQVKRPATSWEKLFAIHVTDKGLVLRIYKEFLLINKKISKQPKK